MSQSADFPQTNPAFKGSPAYRQASTANLKQRPAIVFKGLQPAFADAILAIMSELKSSTAFEQL